MLHLTLTHTDLLQHAACAEGLSIFNSLFPSGIDTEWTLAFQISLVKSPLRPYLRWAVTARFIPQFDLRGADLAGADLAGADLTGAYLTWANLYRANLYRANLYRANLARANLTGADLTWANLARANLTGANLTGANLTGANLADTLGLPQ